MLSLAFIGAQNGTKTSSSSSFLSPTTAISEHITQVNIRDILSEMKLEPTTYKGNLIQVTGIVGSIKKDIMDHLYVTIGTGAQFEIPKIQAFFDDLMNNQLGQLRKGSRLIIVCRVEGLMMNILAKGCVINDSNN